MQLHDTTSIRDRVLKSLHRKGGMIHRVERHKRKKDGQAEGGREGKERQRVF